MAATTPAQTMVTVMVTGMAKMMVATMSMMAAMEVMMIAASTVMMSQWQRWRQKEAMMLIIQEF